MSRTADYAIQGFLYQFNKTLSMVLCAGEDASIAIEGIVEDIDVTSSSGIDAVQCKYHEAQENFRLSTIYKPVLLMMGHFADNADKSIRYRLFAHFPKKTAGTTMTLTQAEVGKILKSSDQALQKYIPKAKEVTDIPAFLARFTIEFGPTLEDLRKTVLEDLKANGLSPDDIEVLSYPNALQKVADMSVRHNLADRSITKLELLRHLKEIRAVAISRWTRSLKNFDQLIKLRKKQLDENLGKPARLRYFLLQSATIENFHDEVVRFIRDYIGTYHHKPTHTKTPVFCLDCAEEDFYKIHQRLHNAGILAHDGYATRFYFDPEHFFREPLLAKQPGGNYVRSFHLRLLRLDDANIADGAIECLNRAKCEDFFIVGDNRYPDIDAKDINLEAISVARFDELRFVLGMRKTYE